MGARVKMHSQILMLMAMAASAFAFQRPVTSFSHRAGSVGLKTHASSHARIAFKAQRPVTFALSMKGEEVVIKPDYNVAIGALALGGALFAARAPLAAVPVTALAALFAGQAGCDSRSTTRPLSSRRHLRIPPSLRTAEKTSS